MEADNKMSQEEYYLKGDIVFAKCEGCLPWPAKISKVLKDGYYGVKFYNHKSTATLHISSLEDFDIKRMKRYKKMHEQSAKKGYKSALIGIEEAANELARA